MCAALSFATDRFVSSPLWDFPPAYRLNVLSERRRRGLIRYDDEPIGDVEYT